MNGNHSVIITPRESSKNKIGSPSKTVIEEQKEIFNQIEKLYSGIEGAELSYMKYIKVFEKSIRKAKDELFEYLGIPHFSIKRMWLLLIHRLIQSFVEIKKASGSETTTKSNTNQNNASSRISTIAACYFIARDNLISCIETEKRNGATDSSANGASKNNNMGETSKKSRIDPDKDKLFKKFLFKFNQDDFDLLKVIKYSQIIMSDKHLDAQITGTCIFGFC